MRLIKLALVPLLAACPADPDDKSFKVIEPTASATFDRCNVRVRTTPPEEGTTWGFGGDGLETKGHVNWRIDGGRETEAKPMSGNTMDRGVFMFGAQLVEGPQQLEIGQCDEFDICTWKPLSVTVNNAIGAPDCRSEHGGQQLFEYRQTGGVSPLADGRIAVIVAMQGGTSGMLMLRPDGAVDTTFGAAGLVPMPLGASSIAQHPDGSFLVHGAGFYLSRVTAAGELDVSFGNAFGTPGTRVMPCPVGSGCIASEVRSDGQGGFWLAGATKITSGSELLTPLLMRMDATYAITAHALVDVGVGTSLYDFKTASVDVSGRAVFVTETFAAVGSMAGVDTTFGTNGKIDLPMADLSSAGAAINGSRVVVARTVFAGNNRELEIRMFDGATAHPIAKLPLADSTASNLGRVSAVIANDGKIYVTSARTRAAEPFAYRSMGPGLEMFVARYVGGTLDASFGTQGVAAMTFRDVWNPVSSESTNDLPGQIVLGADGAPWLVGNSSTFGTFTEPALLRGPCVALAKLRI